MAKYEIDFKIEVLDFYIDNDFCFYIKDDSRIIKTINELCKKI